MTMPHVVAKSFPVYAYETALRVRELSAAHFSFTIFTKVKSG
jgi:hypothetical protein